MRIPPRWNLVILIVALATGLSVGYPGYGDPDRAKATCPLSEPDRKAAPGYDTSSPSARVCPFSGKEQVGAEDSRKSEQLDGGATCPFSKKAGEADVEEKATPRPDPHDRANMV